MKNHPVSTIIYLPRHQQPKRKSLRRPRVIVWCSLISFVLGVCGGVVAYYVHKLNHHVQSYDLSLLHNPQAGCDVIGADGESLGRLFIQDRKPVRKEDYPPYLIEALTATEDSRFYDHGGFDLKGILRAAVVNLKSGRIRQGGSTITQQVARGICQLEGRTFGRKLIEVFLAGRIEAAYDKDTILEYYVNQVYLGSGFWGMGAAARGYFDKDLRELTVSEVALLCAVIKRPSAYSPFVSPELALAARDRTVIRMVQMGYLTPTAATALSTEGLGILPPEQRGTRPQYLLRQILSEAGDLLSERNLSTDSFTIHTSVNSKLQAAAQKAVNRVLADVENRPDYPHPVYGQAEDHSQEAETGSGAMPGPNTGAGGHAVHSHSG